MKEFGIKKNLTCAFGINHVACGRSENGDQPQQAWTRIGVNFYEDCRSSQPVRLYLGPIWIEIGETVEDTLYALREFTKFCEFAANYASARDEMERKILEAKE